MTRFVTSHVAIGSKVFVRVKLVYFASADKVTFVNMLQHTNKYPKMILDLQNNHWNRNINIRFIVDLHSILFW